MGWGAPWQDRTVVGEWGSEKHLHINLLELNSAEKELKTFENSLHDHQVTIFSDNPTTGANINRQGLSRCPPSRERSENSGKSKGLQLLAWRLSRSHSERQAFWKMFQSWLQSQEEARL